MIEERDTSAAAGKAQRTAFRRMSPSERVAIAIEMSEEVRALAADGLRHRLPNASEPEINNAVRRLMLGDELADRLDPPR